MKRVIALLLVAVTLAISTPVAAQEAEPEAPQAEEQFIFRIMLPLVGSLIRSQIPHFVVELSGEEITQAEWDRVRWWAARFGITLSPTPPKSSSRVWNARGLFCREGDGAIVIARVPPGAWSIVFDTQFGDPHMPDFPPDAEGECLSSQWGCIVAAVKPSQEHIRWMMVAIWTTAEPATYLVAQCSDWL